MKRIAFAVNKNFTKIYSKVKHRKGHGIHSPLVFYIVTHILETKHQYYGFKDIEHLIQTQTGKSYKSNKLNKLVFQLVNKFKPKEMLAMGVAKDNHLLYASIPHKDMVLHVAEQSFDLSQKALENLTLIGMPYTFHAHLPNSLEAYSFIMIDMRQYGCSTPHLQSYIFKHLTQDGILILSNIRTNRYIHSLVKQIQKDSRVRISMDLYSVMVIITDRKYQRQHYLLNF